MTQIEELETKVSRQSTYLKVQTEKMNDVHRLHRILMMEKAWKVKLDAEEMERKRCLYRKRKREEEEASLEVTNKRLEKL
jgi:hypothetical protein